MFDAIKWTFETFITEDGYTTGEAVSQILCETNLFRKESRLNELILINALKQMVKRYPDETLEEMLLYLDSVKK